MVATSQNSSTENNISLPCEDISDSEEFESLSNVEYMDQSPSSKLRFFQLYFTDDLITQIVNFKTRLP